MYVQTILPRNHWKEKTEKKYSMNSVTRARKCETSSVCQSDFPCLTWYQTLKTNKVRRPGEWEIHCRDLRTKQSRNRKLCLVGVSKFGTTACTAYALQATHGWQNFCYLVSSPCSSAKSRMILSNKARAVGTPIFHYGASCGTATFLSTAK